MPYAATDEKMEVNNNSVKVFLTGAGGIGWAHDTEYAPAQRALSIFADIVSSENTADVVYAL